MKYASAAVLLCFSATCAAHTHDFYAAVDAGGTWLNSANSRTIGFSIQSDYDTGYNASFRLGIRISPHWRSETELAYASNNVSDMAIRQDGGIGQHFVNRSLNGLSAGASGTESAFIGMVNILYDFAPTRRYHPLIGVGIGGARLRIANMSISGVTFNGTTIGSPGVTVVNDTTTALVYQFIAGMEYDLSRSMAVYADYHYLAASTPRFTDSLGAKFDSEYQTNNVDVGLRYVFSQ